MSTVSKQDAIDRGWFGPVYHGTAESNREEIAKNGFVLDPALKRNGYQVSSYAGGMPAPRDHLGFGVYFTTVKAIAKNFNGGTTKGLREYYLDAPRMEEINFASPNTMMRWWIANGYDFKWRPGDDFMSDVRGAEGIARRQKEANYAAHEQMRATANMTEVLKSKFDAIWYKGKTLRKVLDGDQVVVFDPSRIHMIDPKLAKDLEIGSKVVHNQTIYDEWPMRDGTTTIKLAHDPDPKTGGIALVRTDWEGDHRPVLERIPPPGMKGMIVRRDEIKPEHRQYLPPRAQNAAQYRYAVKWARGGTEHGYLDTELDPVR